MYVGVVIIGVFVLLFCHGGQIHPYQGNRVRLVTTLAVFAMGEHHRRCIVGQGGPADILDENGAVQGIGQGGTMDGGARLLGDRREDGLIGLANGVGEQVAEGIQAWHIQIHPGQNAHPCCTLGAIVIAPSIQIDVGAGQITIDRCMPEQGVTDGAQGGFNLLPLMFGPLGRKGGDATGQDGAKDEQDNRHLQQRKAALRGMVPVCGGRRPNGWMDGLRRGVDRSVHGEILPARCNGSFNSAGESQIRMSSRAPCV